MFEKIYNGEVIRASEIEKQNVEKLREFHIEHIKKWGLDWNILSLATLRRQSISRILYYNDLYRKIIGVPGCIVEFGVQWGSTLAQLIALRGIYEPYNHLRHIYGFDTFQGFVNSDSSKDGIHVDEGDYQVYEGYENRLYELLTLHEQDCPVSHIQKFSLIKGDASYTSKKWIGDNPHKIIAMAIFDMDIYKPTKDALEAIIPNLSHGSILIFDEINTVEFPGEIIALKETLQLNDLKLQSDPHQPNSAWLIFGE